MISKYDKITLSKVKHVFYDKRYIEFINIANKYLDENKSNLKNYEIEENIKVRFMKAKAYRILGKYDECISELKYILSYDRKNSHALTELFFVCYQTKKYTLAMSLLPEIYETQCIRRQSAYMAELVMKKSLGMHIDPNKGFRGDYVIDQIINYDEDLALTHIKSHSYEPDITDYKGSMFNENVKIDDLFNLIKNNLNNMKKANVDEMLEKYYICIFNVGTIGDLPCNFLKVVVEPNTNNIINMYPVCGGDYSNLNTLDCDYSIIFKSKQKTLSQVDKFNRRYSKYNK